MTRIIDQLVKSDPDIKFHGHPRLIRLNPNIPMKTRGNGALSINIETSLHAKQVFEIAKKIVKHDFYMFMDNSDKMPSIVMFDHKPDVSIYYNALQYVLDPKIVLTETNPLYYWPNNSISHVGAIAAVASDLSMDMTYELIAYRKDENFGKVRKLNRKHAIQHLQYNRESFSSIDPENSRLLITPTGPDPVFCGIRGEDPHQLIKLFESLEIYEHLAGYTIFATNQGTDAHVNIPKTSVQAYEVFSGLVRVVNEPKVIQGGHVFCQIRVGDEIFQAAFFEPTKRLRDIARKLVPGDLIFIHGACQNKDIPTIAVEFMLICDNTEYKEIKPPMCHCGERMTSAGRLKGYKCRKCRNRSFNPETTNIPRSIYSGQRVYASKTAQRHLTRPEERLHVRHQRNEQILNYMDFRYVG